MNFCGLVWCFMASLWPYMVFYGRISSFLAVIDPNSVGLVFLELENMNTKAFAPRPRAIIKKAIQFTKAFSCFTWSKHISDEIKRLII